MSTVLGQVWAAGSLQHRKVWAAVICAAGSPQPGLGCAECSVERAAGEDRTLGGWVRQGQVFRGVVQVSVGLSVVGVSAGRNGAQGHGGATGLERGLASKGP